MIKRMIYNDRVLAFLEKRIPDNAEALFRRNVISLLIIIITLVDRGNNAFINLLAGLLAVWLMIAVVVRNTAYDMINDKRADSDDNQIK